MISSKRCPKRRKFHSGPITALLGLLISMQSFGGGRLLGTGGATALEGSAGGGIVPWAVLSGTSTREEHGPTFARTYVHSRDYSLSNSALSYNLANRVELSYARQTLDIGALTGALGFDPGNLEQDVFGVKVRLFGDVLYSRYPQVSAGISHKRTREFAIPNAVGAVNDHGQDYFIAATKVFLGGVSGRNTLVNLTVRSSQANQLGLLGFGGDRSRSREILGEFSIATFINKKWAVGFEYREKPTNLSFAAEDDWRDLFLAYFPSKHIALVIARADLGSIAGLNNQEASYLSLQGSF